MVADVFRTYNVFGANPLPVFEAARHRPKISLGREDPTLRWHKASVEYRIGAEIVERLKNERGDRLPDAAPCTLVRRSEGNPIRLGCGRLRFRNERSRRDIS